MYVHTYNKCKKSQKNVRVGGYSSEADNLVILIVHSQEYMVVHWSLVRRADECGICNYQLQITLSLQRCTL